MWYSTRSNCTYVDGIELILMIEVLLYQVLGKTLLSLR